MNKALITKIGALASKITVLKWLSDGKTVYALAPTGRAIRGEDGRPTNEFANAFSANVQSIPHLEHGASEEECKANAELMALAPEMVKEIMDMKRELTECRQALVVAKCSLTLFIDGNGISTNKRLSLAEKACEKCTLFLEDYPEGE